MPLTKIDDVAALVVIDLQKGIVGAAGDASKPIVKNSLDLIRAFRAKGLPVVLVNVAGRPDVRTDAGFPIGLQFPADFSELLPELEIQPSDLTVTKYSFGAFGKTGLEQLLRDREVTQIFFCGISTSVGVESTARVAFDLGYNLVFVTDSMMDRSTECHEHSLKTIFPRMGELTTTQEAIVALK